MSPFTVTGAVYSSRSLPRKTHGRSVGFNSRALIVGNPTSIARWSSLGSKQSKFEVSDDVFLGYSHDKSFRGRFENLLQTITIRNSCYLGIVSIIYVTFCIYDLVEVGPDNANRQTRRSVVLLRFAIRKVLRFFSALVIVIN